MHATASADIGNLDACGSKGVPVVGERGRDSEHGKWTRRSSGLDGRSQGPGGARERGARGTALVDDKGQAILPVESSGDGSRRRGALIRLIARDGGPLCGGAGRTQEDQVGGFGGFIMD